METIVASSSSSSSYSPPLPLLTSTQPPPFLQNLHSGSDSCSPLSTSMLAGRAAKGSLLPRPTFSVAASSSSSSDCGPERAPLQLQLPPQSPRSRKRKRTRPTSPAPPGSEYGPLGAHVSRLLRQNHDLPLAWLRVWWRSFRAAWARSLDRCGIDFGEPFWDYFVFYDQVPGDERHLLAAASLLTEHDAHVSDMLTRLTRSKRPRSPAHRTHNLPADIPRTDLVSLLHRKGNQGVAPRRPAVFAPRSSQHDPSSRRSRKPLLPRHVQDNLPDLVDDSAADSADDLADDARLLLSSSPSPPPPRSQSPIPPPSLPRLPPLPARLPSSLHPSGTEPFRPTLPPSRAHQFASVPLSTLLSLVRSRVLLIVNAPQQVTLVQHVLHLRNTLLPSLAAALAETPHPRDLLDPLLATLPLGVSWASDYTGLVTVLVWSTALAVLAPSDPEFVLSSCLQPLCLEIARAHAKARPDTIVPVLLSTVSGLLADALASVPAPLAVIRDLPDLAPKDALNLLGWMAPLVSVDTAESSWSLIMSLVTDALAVVDLRSLTPLLESLIKLSTVWPSLPPSVVLAVWSRFCEFPSASWPFLGFTYLSIDPYYDTTSPTLAVLHHDVHSRPLGLFIRLLVTTLGAPIDVGPPSLASSASAASLSEWDVNRLASKICPTFDARAAVGNSVVLARVAAHASVAVALATALPASAIKSLLARISGLIDVAQSNTAALTLTIRALVVLTAVLYRRGLSTTDAVSALTRFVAALASDVSKHAKVLAEYLDMTVSLVDSRPAFPDAHLLVDPTIASLLEPTVPSRLRVRAVVFLTKILHSMAPESPPASALSAPAATVASSSAAVDVACPSPPSSGSSLHFGTDELDDLDALIAAHLGEQVAASTESSLLLKFQDLSIMALARKALTHALTLADRSADCSAHRSVTGEVHALAVFMGLLGSALVHGRLTSVSGYMPTFGPESPWLVRDGNAASRAIPFAFCAGLFSHMTPRLVHSARDSLIHLAVLALCDPFSCLGPVLLHGLLSVPDTAALLSGSHGPHALWVIFPFAGDLPLAYSGEDALAFAAESVVSVPGLALVGSSSDDLVAWQSSRSRIVSSIIANLASSLDAPGRTLARLPRLLTRATAELNALGPAAAPLALAYQAFVGSVVSALLAHVAASFVGDSSSARPLDTLMSHFVVTGLAPQNYDLHAVLVGPSLTAFAELLPRNDPYIRRCWGQWVSARFDPLTLDPSPLVSNPVSISERIYAAIVAATASVSDPHAATLRHALLSVAVERSWASDTLSFLGILRILVWFQGVMASPLSGPAMWSSFVSPLVLPLIESALTSPCNRIRVPILAQALKCVTIVAFPAELPGPLAAAVAALLHAALLGKAATLPTAASSSSSSPAATSYPPPSGWTAIPPTSCSILDVVIDNDRERKRATRFALALIATVHKWSLCPRPEPWLEPIVSHLHARLSSASMETHPVARVAAVEWNLLHKPSTRS